MTDEKMPVEIEILIQVLNRNYGNRITEELGNGIVQTCTVEFAKHKKEEIKDGLDSRPDNTE